MRVLAVQNKVAFEDSKKTLEQIRARLDGFKKDVDLIIFPELFSTAATHDPGKHCDDGTILRFLENLAKERNSHVIGSFIEKRSENGEDKYYNTSVTLNRAGEEVSRYSKIHLFTYHGEDKYYTPGNEIATYELDGVKACTLICYDLRFPEVFREAVKRGVELFVVVANWPKPREEHWATLLKARALENQAFAIGVNVFGRYYDKDYFGGSVVYSPEGKVIAQGKMDEEELIYFEINQSDVSDFRESFPALKDIKKI